MRVLALVTDAFGGHGGIAQYNRDLLVALAACDDVEEVVVLPRGASGPLPDIMPGGIRQAGPVKGRIAYCLAAFWAALSAKRLDAVFCGHLFMTPLAATIAKVFRVPLWVQVHGIDAWGEHSKLLRKSIESATLVTSVSRHTRRRLLSWVGLDPTHVKVLPNTIGHEFFPGPRPEYLVKRHGVTESKVLLTVARLAASERYKGHDRVIEALPIIRREYPNVVYIIVGDGDDRQRLELLGRECGVSANIQFAGAIPKEELADYYRLADVFVMPSKGEGFGIVFLEAIASGIAVIAGNNDGSRDALSDGAFGTLVDPDDKERLKIAICEGLERRHVNACAIVKFSQPNFTGHLNGLVRTLLRNCRRKSERPSHARRIVAV
jgi:phosphatidylinositol alpha-1,6-mannosyltransferase